MFEHRASQKASALIPFDITTFMQKPLQKAE